METDAAKSAAPLTLIVMCLELVTTKHRPYTLDLRSVVRDLVGFTLYLVSWYSLAIFPLLLTAGVLQISESLEDFGVDFLDGISIVEAVVFAINLTEALLAGLLLRWLARGVIEGKRIRTIAAALCAIGAGSFSVVAGYLASENGPPWARRLPIVAALNASLATPLQVIIIGAFLLVVGLVLCIVANPFAKRDRT